jgi:murein L,D-transpeptidase YcbB/YkuD
MAKLIAPIFDYDGEVGDTKKASKLIYIAGQVNSAKKQAGELVLETGRMLMEAQQLLSHKGDGTFVRWLERECGVSRSSGYRAIQVAHSAQLVPKLGQTFGQIETSALYELTANGHEEALAKATEMAEKGVKITHATAKELIRQFSRADEEEPEEDTLPEGLTERVREAVQAGRIEMTDGARDELLTAMASYEEEDQDALLNSVTSGAQSFEQAVTTGEVADLPMEKVIELENKEIDAFCRRLQAMAKAEMPTTPWTEHYAVGVTGTAMQQIKSACASLRTAKCHKTCPQCDGDGCKACRECGRLPKTEFERIG